MVINVLAFILGVVIAVLSFEWIIVVGRWVVFIASFGWVRVAPPDVSVREFDWFFYRRSQDGLMEVETAVAQWIGSLICFICLAVFLHSF